MLQKITHNEITSEDTFKISFHHNHTEKTTLRDSHFQNPKTIAQFIYFTVLFSVNISNFISPKYLSNSKIFALILFSSWETREIDVQGE